MDKFRLDYHIFEFFLFNTWEMVEKADSRVLDKALWLTKVDWAGFFGS